MDFLRDTNTSGRLANAELTTITNYGFFYNGVALSSEFISGVIASNQSVILVEASAPTTQPLVLTIYHGTNQIAQTQLPLSITGVEQMFRHKNLLLRPDQRAKPERLSDDAVPNEPDTNGKNFVFLHGYNVNPDQARGAFADTFKRMYWSGSHAKFYGVTWDGYDTQGGLHIIGTSSITPDLQTNIVNAFLTASNLATFLATLPGANILAAHSLGNMVILSALSDYNAPISKFFMIDAAVPIEAVQANAPQTVDLIHSDWVPYANRLYSHEWHSLFPTNDARSSLTWAGRLANFRDADVYNFYSSGEEVLRDYTGDPPPGFLSSLPEAIWATLQGASGSWVWVWQEKGKGRGSSDVFVTSTHGGWKFNYNSPYVYESNGLPAFMSPSQATTAAIPDSELRTNAFFDLTSSSFGTADIALYGAGGSAYAQANRDRILSDAIPALTLPVGANPVPRLQSIGRNFDENDPLFRNGWPVSRAWDSGNWHHSDFRELAYTFTHQLYDDFVSFGNLQ
jgi:pimeloyl-ACP methyl ester carboxylesterase